MAKICCISDLHGYLPQSLPQHDLLLISGDICPVWNHTLDYQNYWLEEIFAPWVKANSPRFFATWGNHDWIGDTMLSSYYFENGEIIKDRGRTDKDLKMFFTPHQLPFCNWAFNTEEEEMEKIFDKIPEGTDIIVSHGPPKGYGDLVPRGEHTGSYALLHAIERVKPKLVVCGHIHYAYGAYRYDSTLILNASLLGENYKPQNQPIMIDSETWKVI